MAMQALRDGASNGVLKFFLLGLLALAGGGLVFTDVGGFFRGGVSGNDVAKINDQTISIQSFDRLARRTLARMNMTPAQAYQFGYLTQILNTELQRRSLMQAANDASISINDDYALKEIHKLIKPAIEQGVSTEQALTNFLRSSALTEQELMTSIKTEKALGLFGEAIESGALLPPTGLSERLYAYNNETRDIRYLAFLTTDISDIGEPNESELQTLYDNTKEFYAIPETRTITVATLNTDELQQNIEISDEDIQSYYDDFIDNYFSAASRTIVQAVFTTKEDADAAKEDLTLNNFDTKIKDTKADIIPAKDVTEDGILDELKEPVFTAEQTGIIGPIETPLGFTIVKLSQINEEHTKPLNDVKSDIESELKEEQLIDRVYSAVDELDNFFAGGGALDEAKEQFPLETETFKALNRFGRTPDNKDPLNAIYETGSQLIIQTTFALETAGETSAVQELPDGRFAVVHVESITPKTYTPFEDLKKTLTRKWTTQQQDKKNNDLVLSLQQNSAETAFDAIAKEQGKSFKTIQDIKRDDDSSPLTRDARKAVFDAPQGNVFVIRIKNGLALAQVTNIQTPQIEGDNLDENTQEELDALKRETLNEMQNELLSLYLKKLNDKYPATINTSLLERAYGQTNTDEGY